MIHEDLSSASSAAESSRPQVLDNPPSTSTGADGPEDPAAQPLGETPHIRSGMHLQGDFWPEVIRVLIFEPGPRYCRLQAVGVESQRFYDLRLSWEDLARVKVLTPQRRDFTGNGEEFFLGIEAHRVRFAHQFDPLLAISVSQVDPLPHQIEAVYHYILQRPRVRFLLADDPGAGKTIMAGLLLKELKHRGLVSRVLIVVPGHLRDQWLREMKERFGESFEAIDRERVRGSWGRNVWQEVPRVIASMDFAKRDDVLPALSESHWDLIIVDEAHKMAAYRYGEKVSKTERYRLGEVLSRIGQHLLLLTATPHRGNPENFRLFLSLLEPDVFASERVAEDLLRDQEHPLFLRRLKEDLRDFAGRPLFPPRHVSTRTFHLSPAEKELYEAVCDYVGRYYRRAEDAQNRPVAFALLILQRRLASSVRAARVTLERRRKRLQELLEKFEWEDRDRDFDEEELEDLPDGDRERMEDEAAASLTAARTRDELREEIEILGELIRLAKAAERQEIETKLIELRQVLDDSRIRQTQEKLLIFTESRETLRYLEEKLKQWGYAVTVLHGGMDLDARIAAERSFREHTQIMVSTEAGGEGINLQFCSLMVNYDIPWNPNRLEQRMGRIHRYGQKKEVYIYNLVAADTREGNVLAKLLEKLEEIRQALGSDRVFDVIGEVVHEQSLRELIIDAITHRRDLDDIVSSLESMLGEDVINRIRELTAEALATREIDLQRVLGEDRRARENRLVPEYIEQFFLRASRHLGITVERRRDGLWRTPYVPASVRNVSVEFINRYGVVSTEYRAIAFDKHQARRQDAEFVAPGHPLLESIIDKLIASTKAVLRNGAVFEDPEGRLDGWLWFLVGELSDGNNQLVCRRLFAVFQPRDSGQLRELPNAVLWDLKPVAKPPTTEQSPEEGPVLDFVVGILLGKFREEILAVRQREAAIKERYGLRSLRSLLADVEARLLTYQQRLAQGEEIPQAEIALAKTRKEDLERRLASLEEEIRRMCQLAPRNPEVLGVARVIPLAASDPAWRYNPDIEAAGMAFVLAYERSQGRVPVDVSAESRGYDIVSTGPNGKQLYIEVKAFSTTGPIIFTPNEWIMAHRLADDYWLYVVEHVVDRPQLYVVQNPAEKLPVDALVQITRWISQDWKNAADKR